MPVTTLGYRRLIGWIALFGAGLVIGGWLKGAEWASLVGGLLRG